MGDSYQLGFRMAQSIWNEIFGGIAMGVFRRRAGLDFVIPVGFRELDIYRAG
jgi:hypothetical protein